ncbi:MAG: DUF1559 domain-containing protein [Planctomycetota bacterium]
MKLDRKSGFTLVELLVVIAIVGILVGMLFPAIQQVRESARNTSCKNKMRQIGLATLNFESTYQSLPPARLYPKSGALPPLDKGTSQPSWLVRLMPYLEEIDLYEKWDLDAEYEDQIDEITEQSLEVFICPTRRTLAQAATPNSVQQFNYRAPCGCGGNFFIRIVGGATGDYAGNHGDLSPGVNGTPEDYYWGGNGTGTIISSQATEAPDGCLDWIDRITFATIIDGSSNTYLAGELHVSPANLNRTPFNGPIYNGEDLAAFTRVGGPGVPIATNKDFVASSVLGFGSWHPGVCNFVSVDGSVRSINNYLDTVTLGQYCNRRDGDFIVD